MERGRLIKRAWHQMSTEPEHWVFGVPPWSDDNLVGLLTGLPSGSWPWRASFGRSAVFGTEASREAAMLKVEEAVALCVGWERTKRQQGR